MSKVPVQNAGAIGVIKDLSQEKLPLNAWTDAGNMRFLDGSARQFLGHGPAYDAPAVEPLHLVPVTVGPDSLWLYAGAQKVYAVSTATGEAVHTNLTRQTAGADANYAGAANAWTSTSLSGIPILNNGIDLPQQWNLDTGTRLKALDNWPADMRCQVIRAFKVFLIALNITKAGAKLPFLVVWSNPADPGGVPTSWAFDDEASESGKTDLPDGGDQIIDGLALRDSFMIYKEQSVWRMDYTGGAYVFSFRRVLGASGAMNRNCIVELPEGLHFVLAGSDVFVHDGQSATSVLDKSARRALFEDMDVEYNHLSFVFKNPYLNEVFVCYAAIGSTVPNKALVWNYKDRTIGYRDLPNVNHAAYGPVNNSLSDSWASDPDPWDTDFTPWNAPGFVPNLSRVLMATSDKELFLLDASATFNGEVPNAYLERRGLTFDEPERMKRVTSIRPRIAGTPGGTVRVKIGGHMSDPEADPQYLLDAEFVIGQTTVIDCFVEFRFVSVRFETGTAAQWKLDSYELEVQRGGRF